MGPKILVYTVCSKARHLFYVSNGKKLFFKNLNYQLRKVLASLTELIQAQPQRVFYSSQ